MKVYLAGAITGLKYGKATDWRTQVKNMMPNHIATLSPLRGKQYLERRSNQDGQINDSYEEWPLSSARGITTRDKWDVMRCDVVFVNLLDTEKVSIGTVMEIAWASAFNKPVILVIDDKDNIHDHAMIRESIGFRVNSLEKGIEVLTALCSTDAQLDQWLMTPTELRAQNSKYAKG